MGETKKKTGQINLIDGPILKALASLSLPIMVAGFVILTLFMDHLTVMSIAVVTVGYEFFDVLFWALLVGVVRRGGRLPVFVFGWGVGSTYLGMAFGTMLSRAAVTPSRASCPKA